MAKGGYRGGMPMMGGMNQMHLSAVPLLHWIFLQSVKVLVIAVHEQNRKRQGFQPVELWIVTLVTVPDTAEIAADDHVIVLCHFRLR